MSDQFREFVDSREFTPDADAGEDWAEFEAYLAGGIEAIEELDRKRINLELNHIGTSFNVLTGQIDALYSLKGRVDHFTIAHKGDSVARVWTTKKIDELGSPKCVQCIASQVAAGRAVCKGPLNS